MAKKETAKVVDQTPAPEKAEVLEERSRELLQNIITSGELNIEVNLDEPQLLVVTNGKVTFGDPDPGKVVNIPKGESFRAIPTKLPPHFFEDNVVQLKVVYDLLQEAERERIEREKAAERQQQDIISKIRNATQNNLPSRKLKRKPGDVFNATQFGG